MNVNTKTTWARMLGVALSSLIVIGTLLWMQYDQYDARPPDALHALTASNVERALDVRPASNPEMGDLRARMREFNHALADMNEKLAALRAQLAQGQQAQTSPPTPEQDAAINPLARQEAAQQAETQLRAQEAVIEATVRHEPADPAWAPTAQAAIASVFQNKEVQVVRLVDLQCRTTLCRVEVAADEADAEGTHFDQSFRELVLHAPWQGEGFGHIAPPDSPAPTAVFFLARQGHALPQPTP